MAVWLLEKNSVAVQLAPLHSCEIPCASEITLGTTHMTVRFSEKMSATSSTGPGVVLLMVMLNIVSSPGSMTCSQSASPSSRNTSTCPVRTCV